MDSAVLHSFTSAFSRQYNRLPVWLPGSDLALGDVGVLSQGQFTKVATLAELGIAADTDPGDRTVDYAFTSGGDVDVSMKLAGETTVPLAGVPAANAGVGFTFHKQGAFAFSAVDCRVDRLDDLRTLQAAVVAAWDGSWERHHEWVFVTSVVSARRFAIAVALSSGASASLDLAVTTSPAGLGNAGVDAGFAATSQLAASFVSRDATPVMYEAWRVDENFFVRPHVIPQRGLDKVEADAGTPMVTPVTELTDVRASVHA